MLGEKYKLLIADDHPIVLMGMREVICRDEQFEIVGQANNPTDLITLTALHTPDILITDYSMPGDDKHSDGIRLIEYLRRYFPDLRILILTMLSNKLIVSALYDLGVYGVISKRGDLSQLLTALNDATKGRIYFSEEFKTSAQSVVKNKKDIEERISNLSIKEYEVIRHFVLGKSVGDIAQNLNRSVKTVSTQKISAMRKLEVSSDQELLMYCAKINLFL